MTKRFLRSMGALLLVVSACSGTPSTTSETRAGPSTPTSDAGDSTEVVMLGARALEPSTAWEAAIEDLADAIPLQAAIDAFSVAFGPVDGATPTDLAPGYTGSGTGPLRWLLGHWDELTSTQQSQVEDILAGWEEGEPLAFTPAVEVGFQPAAVRSLYVETVSKALVDDAVISLEALLGRSLTIPITVKVAPTQAGLDDAWAVTEVRDANGGFTGQAASCMIIVGPAGMAQEGAEAVSTAAHEAFHCFEAELGTLSQYNTRPAWVIEGMAAWVGEVVAGGSNDSSGWWEYWLDSHSYLSLFSRSYDAIGFYSHVADNGVDLWSRLDEAILASDTSSEDAYQVLIASSTTELVDSWSAGYWRDPDFDPLWDQDGPGITFDAPSIEQADLGNETSVGIAAAAYNAFFVDLDATAEVITFESPGPGLARLADDSTHRLVELHGQALCTTGSCQCPEGTPGFGTLFTDTPAGQISVAPTGDISGSQVVVTGWSLERFCKGERCPVGTWTSVKWNVPRIIAGGYGIPLMITRDGEGYVAWGEASPLYSFAHGGTLTGGAQLLPVKVELSGASHFQGEYVGTVLHPTATAGSFGLTPYIDLGNGWEPTAGTDGSIGAYSGTGSNASFACSGDTLLLNGAIEFSRVSTDATIPSTADAITPTTGAGGGQGLPGPLPDVGPCDVVSLTEVHSLDPNATQPDGPDDLGNPMLAQCTFFPTLAVQVSGSMTPETFTQGAEEFGLTVVDIPGVGDWAVAEISEADPQFGLDESVLIVAAGNEVGTVSLVLFDSVTPGSPEYDTLVQLLTVALSRL